MTAEVDIMVPAYNRWAFTEACLRNLADTTEWDLVRRLVLYDVGSSDLTRANMDGFAKTFNKVSIETIHLPAAPVTDVLVRHIDNSDAPLIAKIDNDTIVPPKWLSACLGVLERNPELDLLGIEAHNPVDPNPAGGYGYKRAVFIGGIGVFRKRAFECSKPKGRDVYFGFTEWQDKNPGLIKGWICPSIPVCLLDRIPFEPWVSLCADYVRKGWQRPWPKYKPEQSALWSWKWRS